MVEVPVLTLKAQNFREIAPLPAGEGRRLRPAMLYRTGDLTRLTESCVDQLRALGIRSVVDLRSAAERTAHPYLWLDAIDADPWGDANATSSAAINGLIRRTEASQAEVVEAMQALYAQIPFSHAQSIGEIVRRVIDGRAPIVFGCAAGKDRTGVAAALLLSQIGVSREDILTDYLATNGALDGLMAMAERAFRWDVRTPHVRAALMADPAYLEASFVEVGRRCGGMEGYFESVLGINEQGRRALREALTEPDVD
ncbi:tyrosine-protein phosphatase [Sphingobium sp. EM0848]|uniref:tyrosine-protein phosphatase n=1 Tax=Sphingobium sp. EM0848 TaxID=2743473 RepID=UPI00159C659C|nr:tyrosine-protein phosphatase [Sphingobium sp. EM0848]